MSDSRLGGGEQLSDDPVVDVALREALATGGIPAAVAVIDDADGAFARALLAQGASDVRVFNDVGAIVAPAGAGVAGVADGALGDADLAGAVGADGDLTGAVQAGAVCAGTPDAGLFDGVTLVVGRLPKALAELEDLAECIVRQAGADARVILGAREKHLRHSMTESLQRFFADVRATRGMRKSRALVATGATPGRNDFPRIAYLDELDLKVAARGGAFAGPTLDLGTRVLLQSLAATGSASPGTIEMRELADAEIRTAVDLGCGTGLIASVVARSFRDTKVIATDASWWACASAAVTAEENGFGSRIEVVRGNAGDGIADASVDLVLCNPPFHTGRQVDPGLANELFRGAARMLRPGGQLFTVFNSHLKHRQHLERIVGPTRQVERTEKFTVTVSTRR